MGCNKAVSVWETGAGMSNRKKTENIQVRSAEGIARGGLHQRYEACAHRHIVCDPREFSKTFNLPSEWRAVF